jgi:VanZ family protein
MKIPAAARSPWLWLTAYLLWFSTLWFMSSGPVAIKTGVEIPHLDKVAHFGYFFGGSGLLSAFLFRRQASAPDWLHIFTIVILLMTAVGCLDEFHQSWVPERTGNDSQDLTADVLGSIAGFYVFKRLHRLLA